MSPRAAAILRVIETLADRGLLAAAGALIVFGVFILLDSLTKDRR